MKRNMNPDVNPGVEAAPTSRRWAVMLAQHAGRVLPGARNPSAGNWGEAMRRELTYIEDDRAALRWALGCVVASYKARLTARPGFTGGTDARHILRHAAACGAVMLVIGFTFLENAESQTEPPRQVPEETACDQAAPSGMVEPARNAGPVDRASDPAGETSCPGRNAPVRIPSKDQARRP
jgi:hypothetical protein